MSGQLPVGRKIGYGVSELGTSAAEVIIRLYLLIFFTDVVGLSPRLAGFGVALGVVWDAVTDPLMGSISDATRSRWGRRRPYIAAGGIMLALSLTLLFSPPVLSTQFSKFIFLVLCYMLVNTCMTVIAVPHAALGRDLTFDPNERTEVYGFRLLFGNIGFLAGTVLPGLLLARLPQGASLTARSAAHGRAAVVIAVLIVAAALVTFFATRGMDNAAAGSDEGSAAAPASRVSRRGAAATDPGEAPSSRHAAAPRYMGGLLPQLASVLKNRVYLPLLAAYFVATIGLATNSTTALYYYRYRLRLPEGSIQLVLAVFIFVFCVSLVLWVLVSRKLGKKMPAFWASLSLGVMTVFVYPFLPPGRMGPVLAVAVAGGFLVGSIVLLESLVADTVDFDELLTRRKREGVYFGFWKMSAKIARACAIAIAGNLLHVIGYVPNETQLPAVSDKLALIFGPGVGFFVVAGAVIFLFMPLTNEKHRRIQALLEKRRERPWSVGKPPA
jgi:GPH family glycoside/pentoside/hexuronide:cation symporter